MRRAGALAAAALLAACFAWLSWSAARRESAAFDESFNIVSGWTLARTGLRPPGQPNPPLLLRWLALPLPSAAGLKPHDDAAYRAAPRRYGLDFVYSNSVPPEVLLGRARAANLLLGVVLLLLTGWWAFRLGGPEAGLMSLIVFAFMPPLLAHSHLATADIGNALLCTAALFLLWRGSRAPGAFAAAAAGFVCGLALAGKYTAGLVALLAPAYLYAWGGNRLKNYAAWGAAAGLGLVLGCLPLSPLEWLRTAVAVARELEAGHPTYLLGEVSTSGTWYYFPLALLLKTPLPALLLAAAGLLRTKISRQDRLLWLAAPAAAWLALGMISNTQVGIRHILPVYPLLCVWAGLAAAGLWESKAALRREAAPLLLAWLAAVAQLNSPWHLSYFNELAGGAAGGHRYLLDSNLDWGQGLKELGAYARERGAEHIHLSYFGCGDPHAYGLKYAPVLMTTCAKLPGDGLPPPGQRRQLLAVSVTNRLGVYYTPRDLFGWLDARTPEKIAGNSIWVYDVTGDTEALKLLSYPGLAQ
ncbi:MAG: hypothetical protein PHV33_04780 [Elusimicrobiales bacterium]|nr:hypothetical protein [Elusimicrobiales bacterium]